jgi:hypothetical protein
MSKCTAQTRHERYAIAKKLRTMERIFLRTDNCSAGQEFPAFKETDWSLLNDEGESSESAQDDYDLLLYDPLENFSLCHEGFC